MTGEARSLDFPTTPGAFDTSYNTDGPDAFVTKLSGDGSTLLYSTFLGAGSLGFGIAVDSGGNAYVTGGASFIPTTPGAFDTAQRDEDGFVTKLNPTGSALVYSTYLGGDLRDRGADIALDSAGNAYVTGDTSSDNFPTTPGAFDTSYNGGPIFVGDAFVTALNPTGSALVYSTFLGGAASDAGYGVAVDPSSAYVTGDTSSGDFPTTPGAFDTTYNGGTDAFVTKLVPSGAPAVLTLSPAAATNPVGTSHTVTATVTDAAGLPVSGVTVRFTVTGAHTASGSCTTGPSGQCTFSYPGTTAGLDTITAFADSDNDSIQDPGEPTGAATKTWTPAPPACPPGDDDGDDDGLEDDDESLFDTLLGIADSDGDGVSDGNDDSDGDGEDDEDEDDGTDEECPNDSDGDGEDDEDEDDDDEEDDD